MTNGWGNSKDTQDPANLAMVFARRDYAVLAYSGLGFGGLSCSVTLDDPGIDGQAASQLVSYLGGAPAIAYTNAAHTISAPPLNVVVHDQKDLDGIARAYDPRVGMLGASYGGAIQFAAASVDHRIDAIIPIDTWNGLPSALAPNSTAQTAGVTASTPGAAKSVWLARLFAVAEKSYLTSPVDPSTIDSCPG